MEAAHTFADVSTDSACSNEPIGEHSSESQTPPIWAIRGKAAAAALLRSADTKILHLAAAAGILNPEHCHLAHLSPLHSGRRARFVAPRE